MIAEDLILVKAHALIFRGSTDTRRRALAENQALAGSLSGHLAGQVKMIWPPAAFS